MVTLNDIMIAFFMLLTLAASPWTLKRIERTMAELAVVSLKKGYISIE
jgi:hypothetical protein